LFFGPYIVSSEEGAQQGDPIGPLLFCNTIRRMLSLLEASLNLGYLDDVTLGGTVKTVASDVAKIIKAGTVVVVIIIIVRLFLTRRNTTKTLQGRAATIRLTTVALSRQQ